MAGRPGDLAATSARSSIRSSAGRGTARSASTASPTALHCTASRGSRPSRSKRQRPTSRGLRSATMRRTRALYPFAFALRGRISPDRRTRSRSRSKSPIRASGARPTPAGCIPAFAGRSAARGGKARSSASKRPSGRKFPTRARRPRRQDHAANPARRPRPAAVRRPVRARRFVLPRLREPVAHFHRRVRRVDHDGISEASSTPRSGHGRARRSCASRPGPATAIRTVSRAISSTSRACGRSHPETARGTKRASSSAPNKALISMTRSIRLRARRRGDRRRGAQADRRGIARARSRAA